MRQRPMSTLIFGILNIGYALMNMAGPLMAMAVSHLNLPANPGLAALKLDPSFAVLNKINMGVTVIFGLMLLVFGIGLLLLQKWGRIGCIVYGILAIVYLPIMNLLMWPFTKRMTEQTPAVPASLMSAIAVGALVFGILIGVGYAAILIYFMTRPNVIEACQPEQAAAPI